MLGKQMASYLVTGGAGFIGSHLVHALVARGHDVRVADDFSTGSRDNLLSHTRVTLVEGDVADPAIARAAVEGCEFVLHQAAIPSVPRSVADPAMTHRANVDGTLQVLLAARGAGVRRVVYAGSSSAYGGRAPLPAREDAPVDPQSPYALQKLVGEDYCRMFTRLYGLETTVIRYFNVFGPRQRPDSPYSGVIAAFIRCAAEGITPTLHGDGGQTRDFTPVDDVVRAVLLAAEAEDASGETINVAHGERRSLRELLETVERFSGRRLEPHFGPPRAGDVRDSQADIGKARRLLGYQPQTSFDEGIRRTMDWYDASRSLRTDWTAEAAGAA
jgi:nucleoside-diphosphate-sugar epimerase